MNSIAQLLKAAEALGVRRIAASMAEDDETLAALLEARRLGLAEPILIGRGGLIRSRAEALGLDLGKIRLVEADSPAVAAALAVELVRVGEAQTVMKGRLESSVILKAVLNKESGLNAGRLVSHVAVLEVPTYHKLLFLTDGALNIAPDLEQKRGILENAVNLAHCLGLSCPKVAVLAALEKVSPEKMPCTLDAAALAQMARRGQIKGCLVDGPLALDNAVSAESARIKEIRSEVAGDADILLAPDIEAGNILYKSLMDLGKAKAACVVMGAKAPIVLTSRADSADVKLASIALAALATQPRDEGVS